MTAETAAVTIDKNAVLARLKELTGHDWHHYSYSDTHDFSATAGTARLRICTSASGKWSWEHSTNIGQGKDYPITASVRQTHDSMEEAAAGLMAFELQPPITVAGAVWHQGTNLYGKPDQRVAVFGSEVAVISPATDGFTWRRDWPEAEALSKMLRDAGCGYLSIHDLSGHAETFEAAAEAAVHATDHLRETLKTFLEVETRALPKGAAWAFLDVCCGKTTVGVIGGPDNAEDVDTPTSPVVLAHLSAALGDMVPGPAWWTKRKGNEGRTVAFAEYLEAVARQLRTDVKGG